MSGTACPNCGGDDRYVLIARPRNGTAPFYWCRQCAHHAPAQPSQHAPQSHSVRTLTDDEQKSAQFGYTAVATWCADQLWTPEGAEALAYLRSRGFTDDTIRELRFGWHLDTWRDGVGPVLWHRQDGSYEGATLGGLLGPQGKPKHVLRGAITIAYGQNGACPLLRVRKLSPGDGPKYLSPAGVELYASARPELYLQHVLSSTNEVILTEGEFKAALAYQVWKAGTLSIPAVAQPGIGYLPDAFLDALTNKKVYLIYDREQRKDPFVLSPGEIYTIRNGEKLTGVHLEQQIATLKAQYDAEDKKRSPDKALLNQLRDDIHRLETELAPIKARNIQVKVVRLPRPADMAKVDLDSFLLEHGPDALQALINTAQDFAVWHADHTGGNYRYAQGKIWQGTKELANYQARILENIVKDDAIDTVAYLRMVLQAPSGPRRTIDISAEAWADPRKAIQAIRANLHDNTWIDKGEATLNAIKTLSRHGDDPVRRIVYTCTGWQRINGRYHFLMPDGAITSAGIVDSVASEISHNAIGNHYALCGPGDPRKGVEALRSLFAGEVCPQDIALPLVAHVIQAALHRFFSAGDRPIAWPYGESGILKTAFIRALLALYGPRFTAVRADGAPIAKWDSTVNSLELLSFTYRDVPFLIDDFKASTSSITTYTKYLHRYSESNSRGRLVGAGEHDRAYPARCLAIATGEDKPTGDYGTAGRTLSFAIRKDDINDQTLKTLQQAGVEGHLAALMRVFLQSVAARLDHDGEHGMQQLCTQLIKEDDTTVQVHQRTYGALRQNRIAWLLFSRFLKHAGYLAPHEVEQFDHAHRAALATVIRKQASDQKGGKPSEIFLSVLREALATGEAVFAESKLLDDKIPPERVIGFEWNGAHAIHPEKAFKLMKHWLGKDAPAYTSAAIYAQLDNDGYIAAKDEKHGRIPKQIKHNGRNQRMLVLTAAALEEPDDDPVTPDLPRVTSGVTQGDNETSASEADINDQVSQVTQVTPDVQDKSLEGHQQQDKKADPPITERCYRATNGDLGLSDALKRGNTSWVTDSAKRVTPMNGAQRNGHKPKPTGGLLQAFNQYVRAKDYPSARNWMDNHPECDWTDYEQRLAAAQRAQEVGE
jgi:hypothetical protein